MSHSPDATREFEKDSVNGAPLWFSRSLAHRPRESWMTVDGTQIRKRTWGNAGTDEIVLVHGGAASSHWWDHIAPSLSEKAQVIAIDMSGHGDSGRRPSYELDEWAREAMSAASTARGVRTTLIGHSLGGYVGLRAAILFPRAFDKVIVVDSPVRAITPRDEADLLARARPHRVYSTRAEATQRFTPRPAQPNSLSYIVDHIASTSVTPIGGGWTWKFDPQIFNRPGLTPAGLSRTEVPVTLMRAEHGVLTAAMGERLRRVLGPKANIVELPDAGHHAMLDQPLALIDALRSAIAR